MKMRLKSNLIKGMNYWILSNTNHDVEKGNGNNDVITYNRMRISGRNNGIMEILLSSTACILIRDFIL